MEVSRIALTGEAAIDVVYIGATFSLKEHIANLRIRYYKVKGSLYSLCSGLGRQDFLGLSDPAIGKINCFRAFAVTGIITLH